MRKAAHPGNDISVYPFGPQCSAELGRVDVVEAALDVEEVGGDLEVEALEETDLMGESRGGVKHGESGEGAGLVGVEEAAGSGK